MGNKKYFIPIYLILLSHTTYNSIPNIQFITDKPLRHSQLAMAQRLLLALLWSSYLEKVWTNFQQAETIHFNLSIPNFISDAYKSLLTRNTTK